MSSPSSRFFYLPFSLLSFHFSLLVRTAPACASHADRPADPSERLRACFFSILLLLVLAIAEGCAQVPVIPKEIETQVDRNVDFLALKNDPRAFIGRNIVLGGMVLSAKRLVDETRIEILQLPLDESYEPGRHLTDSQGRFMAAQRKFLDPATLPPGTLITVVGEMKGSHSHPLDEITYEYPLIDVKSLTVWPKRALPYGIGPYPYFGAYWGSYWGPYWSPLP